MTDFLYNLECFGYQDLVFMEQGYFPNAFFVFNRFPHRIAYEKMIVVGGYNVFSCKIRCRFAIFIQKNRMLDGECQFQAFAFFDPYDHAKFSIGQCRYFVCEFYDFGQFPAVAVPFGILAVTINLYFKFLVRFLHGNGMHKKITIDMQPCIHLFVVKVTFEITKKMNIMKKSAFLTCFLLTATLGFSQVLEGSGPPQNDEFRTIFDGDNIKIGAFGGPIMSFTVIDGQFSHMMGGGGGLMIGGFYFGGYGQGMTNNIRANTNNDNDYLGFGHGGFITGFTLFGSKAVHPTLNALIGWGNVSIENRIDETTIEQDGVFVFEPSLQVELNLTKFFRVAIGGGYRLVSSLDMDNYGYKNNDFSGFSGQLALKFGWF
jgi:hypothetical protein